MPDGVSRSDRSVSTCPAGRWTWLLVLWRDCERTGCLPMSGTLSDQPSWLLSALSALDAEAALIRLAHQADAEERSRVKHG